MKIIINGEEKDIHATTIAEVIKALEYEGDYFAVAKNLVCVPRAKYAETLVAAQDEIEILMPMQGG